MHFYLTPPADADAPCEGVKRQEVRVTVLTILATERDAQVDGCVQPGVVLIAIIGVLKQVIERS